MKFVRKTFDVVHDAVQLFGLICAALLLTYAFFKIVLVELAPVITFLFVLFFTVRSFDRRITTILSLGGIALYAASWPAVATFGVWPGLLVWAIGMLCWFEAICLPLQFSLTPCKTVTA
ncbi:MAG: hypothetical protein Q8P23_04125 [bacterium]|nr:hypothetical protein [bacterium]